MLTLFRPAVAFSAGLSLAVLVACGRPPHSDACLVRTGLGDVQGIDAGGHAPLSGIFLTFPKDSGTAGTSTLDSSES